MLKVATLIGLAGGAVLAVSPVAGAVMIGGAVLLAAGRMVASMIAEPVRVG